MADPNNDEDLIASDEEMHNGDDDEPGAAEDSDDDEPVEEESSDEENNQGDDASGDEDSSSEDEEDDGDDDELQEYTDEHGVTQTLSTYEIQRLKRIARNKAYLSSLGLDQEESKPKRVQQPKKERRRDTLDPSELRSSSRRTAQVQVSYTEPKWRDLNKGTEKQIKAPKKERAEKIERKNERESRMDLVIYKEFKSVVSEKKNNLKQAEKYVRQAEVELKYFKKKFEFLDRKHKRYQETVEYLNNLKEEKEHVGGLRDILAEVDRRLPELIWAQNIFDQNFVSQDELLKREEQKRENERKIEMIDAIDCFPRALKDAYYDLNALLLERAPKEKPPPRRGGRARKNECPDGAVSSNADPDSSFDAVHGAPSRSGEPSTGGGWGNLATALAVESGSSVTLMTSNVSKDDTGASEQAGSKRRKKARNVGGWVSPLFSAEIDRAWIESDKFEPKADLFKYVPQIGDTVLYYPNGHRAFLAAHPDVLGKAMRTKLRLPLWVRAEREKQKLARDQLKKHGEELKADVGGKDIDDDGDDDDGTKSPADWWNDEWLEGVEGKLGNYPLVCVVKDIHAEFPPDPNSDSKVIMDDGNGEVQIVWKVPKDVPAKKRTKSQPPVCLAVNLKPLTPLLPPAKAITTDADREELSPPPNFSVVTFPSKDNAQPFLIPFAWGYKLTHSFKLEDKVRVLTRGDMKGSIKDFATVHDSVGNCRFDDRLDEIAVYVSSLKSGAKGVTAALSTALSPRSRQKSNVTLSALPVTDAYVVIERFTSFLDSQAFGLESIKTPQHLSDHTLSDLIRSTLPIWNGVSVLRHGIGKRVFVSPWELSLGKVAAKSQENESFKEATADLVAENGLTYNIDEPLRAKIECALEDFIKSEEDAAIFYDQVTDEIAPSYSCAVPQGMFFAKVLQRLVSHKAQWAEQPRCFYRTADSLLNDLTAILDNCLLYNSPDSEVVTKAYEIVPSAKRIISSIVGKHVRQKESRSKADDDRRKAVLSQANSSTTMDGTEGDADKSKVAKKGYRAPKFCSFQGPYTEFLNRSWVERISPDNSLTFQKASTSLEGHDQSLRSRIWVPQSGDHVLYSRSIHSQFVKSHFDSFTTDQCALPQFAGILEDDQDAASYDEFTEAKSPKNSHETDKEVLAHMVQTHWLVGKVVWVRAVFPRAPGKERDIALSFKEKSPLLALGITFAYEWADLKSTHIVYWRPCNVSSLCGKPAPNGKLGSSCDVCGCDDYFSFIYPAWYQCGEEASKESLFYERPILLPTSTPTNDKTYFTPPTGLQKDEIASIDRCFNVLKRRCIGMIAPDYVDPKFCTANVKAGWCPTGKMGPPLPTFEKLLKIDGLNDSERAASQRIAVKNRKGNKQEEEEEEAICVPLLAETHFLPPFLAIPPKQIIAKSNGKIESLTPKTFGLKYEEMMCPLPKLCLELVQHRLRSGYYRSRCGILDDLKEAYVNSSLLVLSKPPSKKFGPPYSVRRIAKALSASDGKPPSKRNKYKTDLKAEQKKKGTAIKSKPLKEETNAPKSPKKAGEVSHGEANKEPVDPKAILLSDEETKLMEKIYTAKRLYATALACVSDTAHVELLFGTVPKQAKAKIVPSKEFLDREQRFKTARTKLGMLLAAVLRDPCKNRPNGASPDLPSVIVRISGEGIVWKPQVFSPLDYLHNKHLIKTFFGKPGASDACTRCQVYRRSMLTCRVQKAHSCPDFNWVENFRDVGGIDGLLHMIRTGQSFTTPQIAPSTPAFDKTDADKMESEAKDEDNENGEAEIPKGNDEGDPYDNFEKAQRAITLSNQILELAKKEVSAPARLSQAFIKSYFPIDPSDGKYTTCVVCGLIGDVMCCEGHDCPVVSHPKCVGLLEPPDDDWFCVTCASMPNKEGSDCESALLSTSFDPAVEEEKKSQEFERLMAELQDILDELKNKRNKPKVKGTASIPAKEIDVKSAVDIQEKEGDEIQQTVDKYVGTPESENKEQDDSTGTGRSPCIDSGSEENNIMVGAKIMKNFGTLGDFIGVVKQLASSDNPYYRIRYDDGDEEEMSEAEVHDLLVLSSRRLSIRQTSRGRSEVKGGNSEGDDKHQCARSDSAIISDARRRGRKRGKSIANNIISRIVTAKKDKSTSNRTIVEDEDVTKYDTGVHRSSIGPRSLHSSAQKDSPGQYRSPVTTKTTRTKLEAEQDVPNPSHTNAKRGRPKSVDVREKNKMASDLPSFRRKRGRPRKEVDNIKRESIPQLSHSTKTSDASLGDESIVHPQSSTGKKRVIPRTNEASSPQLAPRRKRARPN